MPRYDPAQIEPKWQRFWDENGTFVTGRLPDGEKAYVLDMFPYPSGDGLHVGHPEGYTATDILCRAARMQGRCVMHPMGFDAFGLPAEEHAIKTGTHPREQTDKNIANFRRQLKMLGFSYDWSRELATTDVAYFRWTQWIFLQLFDTWFDETQQKGRPIAELPIPADVAEQGEDAVRCYQDEYRLAYQSEAPVNWCPALGTVLANEEVVGGVSEVGGHPVVRIPLRQWMLRITAYADRLEADLETLDWPDSIKALQRNWIGRSSGADVDFFIGRAADRSGGQPAVAAYQQWKTGRARSTFPNKPDDDVLRVYTTRPDTLFGATYMVIAPEHPMVEQLTTPDRSDSILAYCEASARKSDLDRTDLAKEKTGQFTGSYAMNPVHGQPIPIWVADYVLISYGTGAIMAVPGHDERDFEFAVEQKLDVVAVVDPGDRVTKAERAEVLAGRRVFTQDGTAVHSDRFDGLSTNEFKERITQELSQQGIGRSAVNYRLRDWLFSRQRFWGEPFPILHELDDHRQPTGSVRAVPEDQLPVDLPELDDFQPPGRPEPPLEKAPDEWLYVTLDGKQYKRETNTMPQWAGSCWYYLRFLDPTNEKTLIDPAIEKAWMPVDLYVGGAEHAVLHLLYARFWHKVLFDRGYVSTLEPFQRLVNQGMILGEVEITGNKQPDGQWVSAEEVTSNEAGNRVLRSDPTVLVQQERIPADQAEKSGQQFVLKAQPQIALESRAWKMSKSRGNVVNPDSVVAQYGADSLRLYEMYMGPLEAAKPWSMKDVNGVRRFLDRVWRMIVDESADSVVLSPAVQPGEPNADQNRVLHHTIDEVTGDIERLEFNTAIARMMEFVNFFSREESRPRSAMEKLVLILSPLAPHICEELWQVLGHTGSLAYEPWPAVDRAAIRQETLEVVVQVQGKVRGRIEVPASADRAQLEAAARGDSRIAELIAEASVAKVIVVPGRLVNFVLNTE